MKLYNKIFASLMVSGLMLTAVSCSDKNENENYSPAEFTGNGVYFASNASTTFNVKKDANTVQVPVYRGNGDGTLTVDITVDPIVDDNVLLPYVFDSKVTFADGEKIGYLNVSYDIEQLEYDDPMKFELTIDPKYVTPYGLSSEIITLIYPSPWTVLGNATYYDALTYDGQVITSYTSPAQKLEISRNDLNPNLYRIVNPYAELQDDTDEPVYFQFEVLEQGSSYPVDIFGMANINIPVSEPNIVGYQNFYMFSVYVEEGIADFYMVMPSVAGALFGESYTDSYNHVVAYQDEDPTLPGEIRLSPIILDPEYGYWMGNTSKDNFISIVFPGFEAKDTSLAVSYGGTLINGDNVSVVGNVTVGEDLTEIKVGVGQGSPEDVAAGIDGGTIESVTVTTSGEVKIPFSSTSPAGKYYVVAVGYIDGEVSNTASAQFTFTGLTPETWSFITEGTYHYLEFWDEALGLSEEVLKLYQSDSMPERYKIENWLGGVDFFFTMDEYGYILVEDQPTGLETTNPDTGQRSEVYVDDMLDWNGGNPAGGYSYYEDGEYNFCVIYYFDNYYIDYGYESYIPLTDSASAISSRVSSFKGFSTKIRVNNPLKIKGSKFGRKLTKYQKK